MSEFYYSCGEQKPTYMGRPRRTRAEYPYSYDPFVIYGREDPKDHAVYSDRLREWDSKKYAELCKKHFGEEWRLDISNPKACEAFMADYQGRRLKLTCIMQHCNWSSGYPLWTFHYQYLDGQP